MMFHHGYGIAGFFNSLLMIIMMALPLIILVWTAFYLFDRVNKKEPPIDSCSSTLDIRLARGEISIDEYRKLKNKNRATKPPAG